MVLVWLPNEQLSSHDKQGNAFEPRHLLKFHPSVIGMFLLMLIFFIFPTNFAIIASHQTALSPQAITIIMVGLDFVAFFVGLAFGHLMKAFRRAIKYFAPISFVLGYGLYLPGNITSLLLGSALIGVAAGVGVPYLNTIASIKGGKNSATTVMPLLSAALYLGQFVSPIMVMPLTRIISPDEITGPYTVGVILSMIFLFQMWATRHFQSLPPE